MFEQKDDAIDLLKRDHREVENLFTDFAKAEDDSSGDGKCKLHHRGYSFKGGARFGSPAAVSDLDPM